MIKKLFFLVVIGISVQTYAQVKYEQGYFINNKGQKINCLIKNTDWINNPTSFKYKEKENDPIQKATIEDIEVFEIPKIVKYIRKVVALDRSPNKNINEISPYINPNFKTEQLFLRVLVTGQANLYAYKDGTIERFFFNKENATIQQLIYKPYKTIDKTVYENRRRIAYNKKYKQQIRQALDCSTKVSAKIKKLAYKEAQLVDYFVAYNQCSRVDYRVYVPDKKKVQFKLNLRPRINMSALNVFRTTTNTFDANFALRTSISFGVESEFILPFKHKKWAILIEPTYHQFSAEEWIETNRVARGKLIVNTDYQAIEIPVGVRHYFYLSGKSKIFANAAYVPNISRNSLIEYKREDQSLFHILGIKARFNAAFGIGYNFANKFSVELRYHTNRKLLERYIFWKSKYRTTTIVFGYTILGTQKT